MVKIGWLSLFYVEEFHDVISIQTLDAKTSIVCLVAYKLASFPEVIIDKTYLFAYDFTISNYILSV